MKAAFVRAPFEFDVRDAELQAVGESDALLEVLRVGICGSDVHLAASWATEWRRFGHETVARVVEVGASVDDLHPGDLVAVRTTTNCGTCRGCMDGEPSRCTGWRATRMSVGLAEQMVVPRRSLWKVDGLSVEAATLIEPLAVAVDLVETADVRLNHDVVVVGPGPIGMMAIRLARLRGARSVTVIGTERDRSRFGVCRALGADHCHTTEEKPTATMLERTAGLGFDRIIVTAPPVALPSALALGRYGGIVAFIGYSESAAGATVELDMNAFHNAKLQLRAAYASPGAPFARANRLLADGAVAPEPFITHRFGLPDIEAAVRLVADQGDGVIKAIVAISN